MEGPYRQHGAHGRVQLRACGGTSKPVAAQQQRGGQVDDAAGYRVDRRRVLAVPDRDGKPHHQRDELFVEVRRNATRVYTSWAQRPAG